jgi:hypothetical protein
VKFDKDMMALLKATKKASKAPAAAIAKRRKTQHENGPPSESPVPDQNIELPPALSRNLRTQHGDLYRPPMMEKWGADSTL